MADKAKFLGGLDLDCYSTIGLHRRIADTGAITNPSSRRYHRSHAIADTNSLVDNTSTSISNDSSTDAHAIAHTDTISNSHPNGYATADTCSHRDATPYTRSHDLAAPYTHSHYHATPGGHPNGHASPNAHSHHHATPGTHPHTHTTPDTSFHF